MVLSVRAAVLHVHPQPTGPERNGLSWATAFNSITQALQSVSRGDEIWVAAGTYKGALRIPDDVALFGGFAGTETNRSQRNWAQNVSVIDWDEWGLEYPTDYLLPRSAVILDRSRLDGFTIINGRYAYGAAIYAGGGGAIIANNIIVTNAATGIFPSAVLLDRTGDFQIDEDFFLKTANALLQLQFSFSATNVPVAQYSPAVHRLLQLAANIYDAAQSNPFPSVFRPRFSSSDAGPIISGYYQDNSPATIDEWLATNPYGIPMVIGARKNLPNFNELSLQTAVLAARRLELRRPATNSPPTQTNEMYVIGISNVIGIEAWNSYTQAYAGAVEISISNVCSLTLSNAAGLHQTWNLSTPVQVTADSWPGFADRQFPSRSASLASFKVPLYTNTVTLPHSVHRFAPDHLEALTPNSAFVMGSGFRVPEWSLAISNRLSFVLSSDGKIIDYVLLQITNRFNLTALVFEGRSSSPEEFIVSECWRTNRIGTSAFSTTAGIQAQIDISLGNPSVPATTWRSFDFDPSDYQWEIESFRQFVSPSWTPSQNTNLVQLAPFTPTRKVVFSATWEANDPLVHTMVEHLKDFTNDFQIRFVRPFTGELPTNGSLGRLNARYRPWSGNPLRPPGITDTDSRFKDPGIKGADDFGFPVGATANLRWLDRVHRGTPWQTLYFDSAAASSAQWTREFLDFVAHPTNDWRVIAYLRSRLDFSGAPPETRVLNNTMVGNTGGGLMILANVDATIMNNIVAYNSSGIFSEQGGNSVELSRNCVFGNGEDYLGDVVAAPRFVSPAAGNFSLLANSPLIDFGDSAALAWNQRPVFGSGVEIGALEFGPNGVPVFTFDSFSRDIQLHGFPGQSYVVDASTNLQTWVAISTNVADMGRILLHDAGCTNYPHRFYRARVAE